MSVQGFASGRAVSDNEASAEQKYDTWAEKIWQGHVDEVIDELIAHGKQSGEPSSDARSHDPREIIRTSRVHYENRTLAGGRGSENQYGAMRVFCDPPDVLLAMREA